MKYEKVCNCKDRADACDSNLPFLFGVFMEICVIAAAVYLLGFITNGCRKNHQEMRFHARN